MHLISVTRRVLVWVNACVLVAALVYGLILDNPGAAFSEDGFVTYASGWQLYLCSTLSVVNGYFFFNSQRRLLLIDGLFWFALASGFLFLAFDEFFMYHESMDRYIHHLFALDETPWTDRLDDVLVGLYVAAAMLVVWLAGRIRSFFGKAKRIFSIGLSLAMIMVFLDVITNGPELMSWVFGAGLGEWLRTWLSVLEDALKLLSVFVFLNGLLFNLEEILLKSIDLVEGRD